MKGLSDLMKQAQEIQQQMQGVQEEIAALEVTGESGAGMAKIQMNGRHEVKRVTLDEGLLSESKEVIEDLIAAACNDAVHKVESAQQEKMSGMTSGLGLPFGKMPF
jgi:DNA-binding YbaB/EbfC family protein